MIQSLHCPVSVAECDERAKTARKVARMHGTPVYFWKNGKVVAEKP